MTLDVTGTVPADCYSLSRWAYRDGPGHLLLATLGSLAPVTLDRLRYRSCDRSAQHASLRSPESIPAASLSVASLVKKLRATPRSRLRSKMSQGRNSPAAWQKLPRRHRRQRQLGDLLTNLPIASTAILRILRRSGITGGVGSRTRAVNAQ